MFLVDHPRHPLSLNPKSQWLALTSNFPELSSHFQANLVDASPGELLSLASKSLLLPSCTTVIANTFRPLLLDLCARWLESSEALEDKLSALCFLLHPHTEIFPFVSFLRIRNDTLTSLVAFFPPSSETLSLNLVLSPQFFCLSPLKWPLRPACIVYSLHTIAFCWLIPSFSTGLIGP